MQLIGMNVACLTPWVLVVYFPWVPVMPVLCQEGTLRSHLAASAAYSSKLERNILFEQLRRAIACLEAPV